MRKKWKKQRWKISEYFCRDQGEKDNGKRKAENAKQTKHFQMVVKKKGKMKASQATRHFAANANIPQKVGREKTGSGLREQCWPLKIL